MKQLCFVISVIALFSGSVEAQTTGDIIDKIWEGAGGKKNWEESRFLTFVFAPQKGGKTLLRRSHLWDRYTGDYRFETKTAKNQVLLVLFNVNSKKGQSFINGKPLSDSLNVIELKNAYSYFVNDSYWLLAPLRLEDPGVKVFLEQSEEIEGTSYYVLRVNFEKGGMNPAGQSWFYVDPGNGQVKRSKFFDAGKKDPHIYTWTNYKDLGGGLKLSTRKQNIDRNNAITFPVASVLISVEPEKFTNK
jgi:hypothetical protein